MDKTSVRTTLASRKLPEPPSNPTETPGVVKAPTGPLRTTTPTTTPERSRTPNTILSSERSRTPTLVVRSPATDQKPDTQKPSSELKSSPSRYPTILSPLRGRAPATNEKPETQQPSSILSPLRGRAPTTNEKPETQQPSSEAAKSTQPGDNMSTSAPRPTQKPAEIPLSEEPPTASIPCSISAMSSNALGSTSTATKSPNSVRASGQTEVQERPQTQTETRPAAVFQKPTMSLLNLESLNRERSVTPPGTRPGSADAKTTPSFSMSSFESFTPERSRTPAPEARPVAADSRPPSSLREFRAPLQSFESFARERSLTPLGTRPAAADRKPTPTTQDVRAPVPPVPGERPQTPVRTYASPADEKPSCNLRIPTPIPTTVAARQRSLTPTRNAAEDMDKVMAWQSDVDSLEEAREKLQQDQMSLVHNQINILKRELGDLQKKFALFQNNLQAAQEEAHSAVRVELAEHSSNASELRAAWDEAHSALCKAVDEGLGNMAAEHAKVLESHRVWDSSLGALTEHAQNHGNSLSKLEDLSNKRYQEHTACLEEGLKDVHGKLLEELAELRSGHAVNLQKVVEEVTSQFDILCIDVTQMTQNLKTSQEEAHSSMRMELAKGGNSAAEMKATWDEAFNELFQVLESHKTEQAKALEDCAEILNNHSNSLRALEDLHNKRYEEHSGCLQKGLSDLQDTWMKQSEELLSGHTDNLEKAVTNLSRQVENLTQDVEQLASDAVDAQKEGHSALRLEIGNNAAEMKESWAALQEELRGEIEGHANNLRSLRDFHAKHLEPQDRLQRELTEFRSGQTTNLKILKQVLEDLTQQVDNLASSVETEVELRKLMEVKLDDCFGRIQGPMLVSFLGSGADDASDQPEIRTRSPFARGLQQPAGGQQLESDAKSPAANRGDLQLPARSLLTAEARAKSPTVGAEQQAEQQPASRESPSIRWQSPADQGNQEPTTKLPARSLLTAEARAKSQAVGAEQQVEQQPASRESPNIRWQSPADQGNQEPTTKKQTMSFKFALKGKAKEGGKDEPSEQLPEEDRASALAK